MSLKNKLMKISANQKFHALSSEDMSKIVGGLSAVPGSCGQTASSDRCDNTAVCNCPPPPPVKS